MTAFIASPLIVMPGFSPGIHAFFGCPPSAGMTIGVGRKTKGPAFLPGPRSLSPETEMRRLKWRQPTISVPEKK